MERSEHDDAGEDVGAAEGARGDQHQVADARLRPSVR
jgi:hypothetical protein